MLSIDNEKCIQCGTCIADCNKRALKMTGGVVVHDEQKCMWCGHCMAVCPRDCIVIDGDGYNCEEVEDLVFAPVPNSMAVRNMILKRRSVRRFTGEPVTDEEIEKLIEAAKYAPTGKNLQGNALVIVRGEKVAELNADAIDAFKRLLKAGKIPAENAAFLQMFCDAYDKRRKDNLFYGAPVVVFVFADTDVDGAIAASNIGWMAQSMQLGWCYVRIPVPAYMDEEFAKNWKAPAGKRCVIALLAGKAEPDYFCSVPRLDPPVEIIE